MAGGEHRTALIVVVPEVEPSVRDVRLRHDRSAALGVPAHVTVLFPFAPSTELDEQALADVIGRHPAFDFVLDRVEQWEEGIVWLHPEPSQPFEELTTAISRRWPEYPPYGGAHETVVPHLTVSERPIELDVRLPIRSRADAVSLIEEAGDGTWSTRRVFRLAGR